MKCLDTMLPNSFPKRVGNADLANVFEECGYFSNP